MFCAKTHFKAVQRNHDPNYTLSDYGTLERNTDAAFYFTSPFLGQVMPRLPNAINVGFIHCRSGNDLSVEIKEWINSSTEPIIFMSMGSSLQLPDNVLLLFEQVFEKLPVRVIWKRNQKHITKKYYQLNWLPQQDLLASKRISLFISQLGMVSFQESVYHAVPVLGLPLTYEQKLNKNVVLAKNVGKVLEVDNLKSDALISEISILLNSSIYLENIRRISSFVKQTKNTPLEDAVWWSEYTMNNKGCDHLKSPYRDSADLIWKNVLFNFVTLVIFTVIISYCVFLIFKNF